VFARFSTEPDNLLFRETDLRAPEQSELFAELRELKDPLAVELVNRVASAVPLPLEQAPLLEVLFPERKATPARPAAKGKQGIVEKKPGEAARPAPSATIQSEPSTAPAAADAWGGLEQTGPISQRLRKTPEKRAFPLIPVAVGGGVAGLVLVGLLAWVLWPATPKKPVDHTVAQAGGNENRKPQPILLPRDKDKNDKQPDPVPVNPPVKPPPVIPPVEPVKPVPIPNPMDKPPPLNVVPTGLGWPHPNPVLAVAVSRDGKTIATGCDDGTIRVRDMSDQRVRVLRKHTDEIRGLVFTADGKTLVSASRDKTLKLWDVTTGAEKVSVVAHPEGLTCLAISADGKLLATGSKDRTAKVWDTVALREKAVFSGHESAVTAVAFSPDGKTLATACDVPMVRLWNPEASADQPNVKYSYASNATAVAFSSDGKTLAAGLNTGAVICHDLSCLEAPSFQLKAGINALAYSPDGRFLAGAGADGIVYLQKVGNVAQSHHLQGMYGAVTSLAFDASGQTLVVGGSSNKASVWTLATPNDIPVKPAPPPANGTVTKP